MKEKQVKLPGPDHPISIQRNPARVVVSVAGRVVADAPQRPDSTRSGVSSRSIHSR
jgi:uncharacterized protein (DUF427 family)